MENLDPLDQETSSLDRFKKRLEKSADPGLTWRSTRLPLADTKIRRDWGDVVEEKKTLAVKSDNHRWLNYFFFSALFFFLATVGVAFYVLFFSANIVSESNIDIEIKGPTQLRSGDELDLETTIRNRNKITLRNVSLTLTYPDGTVESLATGKKLPLERKELGELGPGISQVVGSRAVIFGAQNSNQKVTLKIEYKIPDSNAVFTKETEYAVVIGSGTLDLSFELPSEINNGKNFKAKIKITSNAKSLLSQLAVRVDYPSGFNFESADPEPVKGNQTWFIGDLLPGASREIVITGSLVGQSEEFKSFKVVAGLDKSSGQGDISTEYGSIFKTVNLKKDFVGLALNTPAYVAPGGLVSGSFKWINNLDDKVIDGTLELYLSGMALDRRTVESSNGFYNSLTNSIIWDQSSLGRLTSLEPGDQGSASFNFDTLPLSQLPGGVVPPINLRVVFKGTRVNADETTEEIISEASRSIKIGSAIKLVNQSSFYTGPFKNSGPLPPKVGEETTYTITWSISNPTNDLKGVKVSTILPIYVKWLSNVSPLDENLVYNNTNRELVWTPDKVSASSEDQISRTVSFQISLTPSLSQVNQSPALVGDLLLVAEDTITGEKLRLNQPGVNTRFSTDPGFNIGQEKVTE